MVTLHLEDVELSMPEEVKQAKANQDQQNNPALILEISMEEEEEEQQESDH
jgi:hypothetical protein